MKHGHYIVQHGFRGDYENRFESFEDAATFLASKQASQNRHDYSRMVTDSYDFDGTAEVTGLSDSEQLWLEENGLGAKIGRRA